MSRQQVAKVQMTINCVAYVSCQAPTVLSFLNCVLGFRCATAIATGMFSFALFVCTSFCCTVPRVPY